MGQMLIKRWEVTVSGFPTYPHYAASRGKALRDAWWSYSNYRDLSFKDFLRIAKCVRGDSQSPFGDPITVAGAPAFFVSKDTQYVQFVRPDSDVVLNSHPYDVEPEQYRSEPYRKKPPVATPETERASVLAFLRSRDHTCADILADQIEKGEHLRASRSQVEGGRG